MEGEVVAMSVDHIIIDTNYLVRDPKLEFAVWNDLVTLQKDGTVKLYLPIVVLREHMRHEEQHGHQEINKSIEAYEKAHIGLSKIGLTVPPMDKSSLRKQRDEIAATREFEAEFRGRLRASGVTVLPYPAVDTEHLAEAYFAPNKPFKANGEGLADYLIWRSAVDLLATLDPADRIVLISANTTDFVYEGRIHPDLVVGLDASRFAWHRDPNDYVKTRGTPAQRSFLLSSQAGRNQLVESAERDLAVEAAWEYIDTDMLYREISSSSSDWAEYEVEGYEPPHFFQNPEFGSIDLDEDSAAWSPYERLSGGGVLGRLLIDAEVGIGAYVNKSDLAVYEDVSVINFDHNDYMSEVADTFRVTLEFHVRVDQDAAKVLNVESIKLDN